MVESMTTVIAKLANYTLSFQEILVPCKSYYTLMRLNVLILSEAKQKSTR